MLKAGRSKNHVLAGQPRSPGRKKLETVQWTHFYQVDPTGLALCRFQMNVWTRMEGEEKEGRKERWGKGREGRLKVVGIFLLPSSSKNRVLDRHRMKKSSVYLDTPSRTECSCVCSGILNVFIDFFHGIRNGRKKQTGKIHPFLEHVTTINLENEELRYLLPLQ